MLSYSVSARVLIVTISTRTFVLLLVMTDHAAVQEKQMDFIVALMKNYEKLYVNWCEFHKELKMKQFWSIRG